MKAFVTGFEPFGGQKINASFEAVRRRLSMVTNSKKPQFANIFLKSIGGNVGKYR